MTAESTWNGRETDWCITNNEAFGASCLYFFNPPGYYSSIVLFFSIAVYASINMAMITLALHVELYVVAKGLRALPLLLSTPSLHVSPIPSPHLFMFVSGSKFISRIPFLKFGYTSCLCISPPLSFKRRFVIQRGRSALASVIICGLIVAFSFTPLLLLFSLL